MANWLERLKNVWTDELITPAESREAAFDAVQASRELTIAQIAADLNEIAASPVTDYSIHPHQQMLNQIYDRMEAITLEMNADGVSPRMKQEFEQSIEFLGAAAFSIIDGKNEVSAEHLLNPDIVRPTIIALREDGITVNGPHPSAAAANLSITEMLALEGIARGEMPGDRSAIDSLENGGYITTMELPIELRGYAREEYQIETRGTLALDALREVRGLRHQQEPEQVEKLAMRIG